MKANEIVEQLKQSHPKLFAKLPEGNATKLVNAVLRHTAQQINDANEGTVKVAGLGVFRIKQREQEKDGEKRVVKRVSFKIATAKKTKAETK